MDHLAHLSPHVQAHHENPRGRHFLKSTALLSGAAFALPRFNIGQSGGSPNSKVNIAMIGAGGIAGMAYGSCCDENVVGLCDVDETKFGQHKKTYPARSDRASQRRE